MNTSAEFLSYLATLLGPAGIRTSPEDTQPYATDWRRRYSGTPLAVVFPRSTYEVAEIVKAANQFGEIGRASCRERVFVPV